MSSQPQPITRFWGEYRYLSNFFLVPVHFEGVLYPSSEHAYMAAKTLDLAKRQEMARIPRAADVKRVGRQLELRPDWEQVKVSVMERVLHAKFTQNPALGQKLIALAGVELIEGNTWGDRIWGAVWNPKTKAWEGQNLLGKALMDLACRLVHELPAA